MAASIDNPQVGYAGYFVVKAIGYSLVTRFMSRRYAVEAGNTVSRHRRAIFIGVCRALLGVALGCAWYKVMRRASAATDEAPLMIGSLLGLAPVRFAEWWVMLRIFGGPSLEHRGLVKRMAAIATGWSFALDVPALFAFLVAGGFSVG